MKKLLALILSLCMVLSMAACGAKKEAPAPAAEAPKATEAPVKEEPVKEEPAKEENKIDLSAEDDEAEDEEAVVDRSMPSVLPEVKGTINEMDFELVGIDYSKSSDDDDIIRFWYNVTNNSESLQDPSTISSWDITVMQDDEELMGLMSEEPPLEEEVAIMKILPGVTVQFADTYMLNDKSPVLVEINAEEETFEFQIDPETYKAIVPEKFEWEPMTDVSWFDPISDEYYDDLAECDITIVDIQTVPGTDWLRRNEMDVVRVVYNVVNESEKERYVSGSFIAMQDGVQMQLGLPKEEDDKDIRINTKFAPGEEKEIAVTFVPYNNESPVLVLVEDFGEYYGKAYEIEK